MTLELNPVAFTSAPLLRAIAAGGWTSKADLARRAGRHPNNLPRDLTVLWEAGLINEVATPALTEHAQDQLAALDRAENPAAQGGSENGLGVTHALHADLVPDPDQPRKDFSSARAVAELEELRDSLIARGRILQPIVVRALADVPGRFIITDGERRWRAAGMAMDACEWPRTEPLPITIQETDGKETKLAQLTANMVRADMTPLEECDAFDDLIVNHAMTTAEIAAQIGKSQKFVQNRLRLRQLSADDRARMALPEDHPDHLGYKAALQSLMTPRERGEEGATDLGGESGSPAQEAAPVPPRPFGTTLTDAEALALVEIAHKSERDPDADYGSEAYTPVSAAGIHGAAQSLVTRGLIGFRQKGMTVLVKPRLFTTPYGEWLRELGFYAGDSRRRAILSEFRNRVHGPDVAARFDEDEGYATAWLNADQPITSPAMAEKDREAGEGPSDVSDPEFDAREAGLVSRMESHLAELQDDQPALIEESAEERAARAAAGREREAVERDQAVVARFSEEMLRAMADARAGHKLFGDLFGGQTSSNDVLDDLVGAALGGLAVADPALAGAALAHLVTRGGSMGAAYRLKSLTLPAAHDLMLTARVEQSRPLDDTDAEPDPVEDFVQAELPEGEDEHEASEAPTGDAAQRPVPAVPIRKSITPDFIVCLEDGRKFRSLKRHLRTRYDLTPEEYIARWGLPRDYPMVAPNYAKARADLARQMGLREPV